METYNYNDFKEAGIDVEMKSAENTVTGAGLIVLNEFHINACFLEIFIIVCFHEISSGITKYSWLDHFQSFNISADFISRSAIPRINWYVW